MRAFRTAAASWGALSALLTLAACDRAQPDPHGIVVVDGNTVASKPIAAAVSPPPVAPTPAARPRAVATIAASPPGPNPQLARAPFRSPPLPRELTQENTLLPLPPRPVLAETTGEQIH